MRGQLRVKVVSEDGSIAALGPAGENHYAYGRARTKLVIIGSSGFAQTISLDGNFEPEAFSTDGRSLFVIKYLPARSPSRYQVRRLDLSTGQVHAVYTPDAHLQRAMGGTARIQAVAPDGRRLYTLYTVGSKGDRHAFIHVLSLDELWAHCINLPDDFAVAAERSTALAVSPEGDDLYVANAATGMVAAVDTQVLGVRRTGTIDLGSQARAAYAAAGPGPTLYLAGDRHVVAVARTRLSQEHSWTMEERVTGIQPASDRSRLYVGLKKRVLILNADTGQWSGVLDPPGIGRIYGLGPAMRSVYEPPPARNFQCAC